MLLAVLEFTDFAIIAVLISLIVGAIVSAPAKQSPAERERLKRIEDKLESILTHLEIRYVAPRKPAWQELADDPERKIQAIKVYREHYGVDLAQAKKAVEDYIGGRGG